MAPAGLSRPGSTNKRASRHVATAPVPGDGLTDIYFTNGASLPSLEKTSPRYWSRLYRNLGGFRFQDVTEKAGVAGAGYSMGTAAARSITCNGRRSSIALAAMPRAKARLLPSSVLQGPSQHVFSKLFEVFSTPALTHLCRGPNRLGAVSAPRPQAVLFQVLAH